MQMWKWDDWKTLRFTVDETIFQARIRCLNFFAKVVQTYHGFSKGQNFQERVDTAGSSGQEWKQGDGYWVWGAGGLDTSL